MHHDSSARRRATILLQHLRVPTLLRALRGMAIVVSALAVATILAGAAYLWGFVQDDTFISLRYAQNLTSGHGLVFNPGERVEGITNVGWTLLAAALLVVRAPALLILRLLGVASAALMVLAVAREGARGRARAFGRVAGAAAAVLLATSPSLQLWSVAGLEEVSFALLAFVALESAGAGRHGRAAAAAGTAAFLRPEGAIVVAAFGVTTLARAVAARRWPTWKEIGAPIAAGIPAAATLLFRVVYYGEWLPNTFFVKAVVNADSVRLGLSELRGFASTGSHGVLLVGGAVGLVLHLARGRADLRWRALAGGAFASVYLVHMVRVGGDVLPLYRLWIPLLPFAATWSARLASQIACEARSALRASSSRALIAHAFALASVAALVSAAYVSSERSRYSPFRGVHAALEATHGRIGRDLGEAAAQLGRPVTVAAQDIGLTAAVAPSLRVVDVIGLADRTVAKTVYRHGYTPYIRMALRQTEEGRARVERVDAELRDYLFARNLDYIVVNVYCAQLATCRRKAAQADSAFFAPLAKESPFYYEVTADPRFARRFELVSVRPYSNVTYLLVYRARELGPQAGGPAASL